VIAYLDSSVLLRVVLGQRNALKEWGRVTQGITSALAEVECLRTLDRLRLAQGFADEMIAEQREAVYRLLEAMEIVEIRRERTCRWRLTTWHWPSPRRQAGYALSERKWVASLPVRNGRPRCRGGGSRRRSLFRKSERNQRKWGLTDA
jgi:hypothetical protein